MNKIINLKLMLSLLVCFGAEAMSGGFTWRDLERCDNYTQALILKLKNMEAWYDPEPAKDTPLDESTVTATGFWRRMQENKKNNNGTFSEQDEKDIKKVCYKGSNNDYISHVHRCNVAAALHLGFSLKYRWMQKTLSEFVLCNDLPLITLALEKGFDPNVNGYDEQPVIFAATIVEMAELLRSYGANFNVVRSDGGTLLHNSTIYSRAMLIPYYAKHGVNPLQLNRHGETALRQGISEANYIAAFLEAGVSEDDIWAVGQAQQQLPFVKQVVELYHKNKR